MVAGFCVNSINFFRVLNGIFWFCAEHLVGVVGQNSTAINKNLK